jgi:hypothetical protein
MLLQRKIDRAMDWLKDKNNKSQPYIEDSVEDHSDLENFDPKAEWLRYENENIQLEKNDFFAIVISALLVFSPIFIILAIIIAIVV